MDYFSPKLLAEIRDQFAFVEECPFVGERIFFENAGGALTLKSVVETSAKFAAIPDNQGRANAASSALMEIIQKAKLDASKLLGQQQDNFLLVKVAQNYFSVLLEMPQHRLKLAEIS